MPLYDRLCSVCQTRQLDLYEPVHTPDPVCACGGTLSRAWLTTPASVIGDACDVWIKHGICNEDGTPRHYTSKADMRREAERRGVTNVVRHVGRPGSDKSPHTSRWI